MLPFFQRATAHYHTVLTPFNQVHLALVGWVNSRTVAFVCGVGLGPLHSPGASRVPAPSSSTHTGCNVQVLDTGPRSSTGLCPALHPYSPAGLMCAVAVCPQENSCLAAPSE